MPFGGRRAPVGPRRLTSIRSAVAELGLRDPVIAAFAEELGPPRLRRAYHDHFGALCRSILYQQLAGKAAAAIHGRFLGLFEGTPSPEAVLALPEPALRGAGLSGSKAASIRDLAAKVVEGSVVLEGIERLPDDEVVDRLVAVRGIGVWTAEMFLIFRLARLDVWPVTDYGVRTGYALAYGLGDLPSPKELFDLGERFRPYRTIAAWYCWRAVERERDVIVRPTK